MEKPQQNESRKKLADKLRGARELDKGLADQYLAKVSATEDYKTNKKQTRSEFKEFKNSERDAEKQEKIDALKREIEGMGTAAPEETNDGLNVVAEEDPALIPEFRKEDTPILPAEPEKVQPVELTGEIKNMTPEGQVIINSLIKRKEAFEIKTKEETEGIKQDYQKSLDSIDSRVSGFNDKYKEFCESTDLRIKARNDKYKEFCDEIDLRIKAVQEKEEGDKWQKEREVADLNREKQNEGFRTEREVADLNREKQNEGFRTEREVQSIKNEKYRVDSRYEQDLRDAKNRAERALKEIEEKIAQAKIDGNPETLKDLGPLENSLRDKISILINSTESEEDMEAYQAFISGINNLKASIRKNKLEFQKNTAYTPTIENMVKYSKTEKGKSYSDEALKEVLKNLNDPKKAETSYGYLKSVKNMTPLQIKEVLKAFGFGEEKQLRDLYEEYNKRKTFLQPSVKQGKTHEFKIEKDNEGVGLKLYNNKYSNGDDGHFYLNQKFLKELFEGSKI